MEMEQFADRLRAVFNARDIDTFRELLAEDARWGEDPDGPNTCHNRAEIIANVKRLMDAGIRASMVETTAGSRGVACLLDVEWPNPKSTRAARQNFYQTYLVTDGLITEIQGHDNRESALAPIEG